MYLTINFKRAEYIKHIDESNSGNIILHEFALWGWPKLEKKNEKDINQTNEI